MLVLLIVVLFVLGGLLLAFDTFALGVGVTGIFGGGLRRCPTCGRLGMSQAGVVHGDGCPAQRVRHAADGTRH
jgi:hypothetical protein